jgi:TP901 family phage tail tape measure protein
MATNKEQRLVEIVMQGKQPEATLKDMEKAAAALNAQLKQMPTNTKEFAEKAKELQGINSKLKGLKDEVKGVSGAFGQLNLQISRVGEVAAGMLISGGLQGAIAGIGTAIASTVKANRDFEKSLNNLQALTGVSRKELNFFKDAAREMGRTTSASAQESVEAMKLIASAKPDLLTAKEALVEVTKQALLLANASGMDLPEAAKRLTDAMNQFGAPARDAGKYVNILAEGARLSAAEVPDITSALLEFGVAAKSSNVSISESVALIEAMAEKGIKGAEAGTKLRNVLAKGLSPNALDKAALADLKAYGVNIELVSDKTLSLQTRLQELSKIKDDDIALTHVFGLENKIAGQVILENTERVNELSIALGKDGLNSALTQAQINTDNLDGDIKKLNRTWADFTLQVGDSETALNKLFRNSVKGAELFSKAIIGITNDAASLFTSEFWSVFTPGGAKADSYNSSNKAMKGRVKDYSGKATGMSKDELDASLTLNYNYKVEYLKQRKELIDEIAKLEKNKKTIGDLNLIEEKKQQLASVNLLIVEYKEKQTIIENNLKQIKDAEKVATTSDKIVTTVKSSETTKQAELERKRNDEILKMREQLSEQLLDIDADIWRESLSDLDKELAKIDERFNKLAEKAIAAGAGKDVMDRIDALNLQARGNAQNRFAKKNEKNYGTWEEAISEMDAETDAYIANKGSKKEKRKPGELSDAQKEKINTTQTVANQVANIWGAANNLRTQQEDRELMSEQKRNDDKRRSYDKLLLHKKITQKQYNDYVAKLDEDMTKKENAIKLEQAKREKRLNIFNSIINTASAVAEALPNIPLSVIAGVAGGIQTGIIAAQPLPEFAMGGQTTFANGGNVSSARVGLIGERGPEWVAPNWMMHDPQTADVIGFLERYRKSGGTVRGFADGGNTGSASVSQQGSGVAGNVSNNNDLVQALNNNTAVMQQLINNGVMGVWDWDYYNRSLAEIERAKGN